jgi:hypothetical protein
MIKCNICTLEKEPNLFRIKKKSPLCFDCYNKQKKEKYRLSNPKKPDICVKCGIERKNTEFVKNTNCCKDCKSLYIKEYYENNKLSWVEYVNKSNKCPERKKKQKEYVESNKDKIKEYQKKYREENKENIKKIRKEYNKVRNIRHKERYENDIEYKVRKIHRSILKSFLRRMKIGPKKDTTSKVLGYSYSELKEHLESLFLEGMTWNNHGEWHIDHIKPISSFEVTDIPSVVNSLENLQPLWAIDNMRKSDKY